MQLPDNPYIYVAIAVCLAISLLAAQSKVVRRVVSLAVWFATIAFVTILLAEQGRYHPTIATFLQRIDIDRQEVVGGEVRVPIALDGHYWVRATIGGVERRMLVDTGATITALSTETAASAGKGLRLGLTPVVMQTANGAVAARTATLDRLSIGPISATRVPVVISPSLGRTDVLGMNFLSALGGWRVEDGVLILTPRKER